jgi:DNA-binding MarR family transcriptional regulator
MSDPPPAVGRDDLGFLLAKAAQRWNELLAERFAAAGYGDVSPSYGSVLVPLYEEDGLRLGELARRSRLSKQTMTELVRRLERDGLVDRRPDPADGRAALVFLTARARELEPVAAAVLAEIDHALRAQVGDRRADELKATLTDLLGPDDGAGAEA